MRPEEMTGHVLGHYRIIRPLGYGGSSTVFLAQDINLQREVAVKVFQPRDGETRDFLHRFAREARVLAQLDHPNILPVYDYGEEGDSAYLVMPHMAGGSLRDRMRKQHMIPASEAIQLISQMLNALQYAHDRGLIHRDIKPGNMLFKADGTLLLSDFGLVKVLSGETVSNFQTEPMSITGQSLSGTPDYMAPEQINGQAIPASDVYATGVVLYEMLTGSRLFTAENYVGVLMKHLYEQPRPMRELNPAISPALEEAVMRALAKEPAKRYQHPRDFLSALVRSGEQETEKYFAPPLDKTSQYGAMISDPGLVGIQGASNVLAQQSRLPYPPVMADFPGGTQVAPDKDPYSPVRQSPHAPDYRAVTPPEAPQRSRKLLITVLILLILVLATSLGGVLYQQGLLHIPQGRGGTPQPGAPARGTTTKSSPTNVPTGTITTQNVPPTQLTCPTSGAARTAITAPLALGNNQNVIYIVNEKATATTPAAGTVKRRDVTTNTRGVEIQKMLNTAISEAQVSDDGRWVLFIATVAGQVELRMVRVDGQGLQTLYCAPANGSISHLQWSYNQQLAVFNVAVGSVSPITYLMNLTTGNIQPELVPQSGLTFIPRVWINDESLFMYAVAPDPGAQPQNIYILNTSRGANQHENDLQTVIHSPLGCADFDSSYDNKQLILSTCTGVARGTSAGPSSITIQPIAGGPATTIYTSNTLAIIMVRAISPTTLLFLVENGAGDTSKNGLWSIHLDGTGLRRLTTDTTDDQSLCPFTQYAWSNVSLDGAYFALQSFDAPGTYRLYSGSISQGGAVAFADISDGTQLKLVGWTNL
ncbi:MAG TPA: serine/threonine-protein kinase [Ktedonobacteraceae bacterium]|nr:serine/threonine-protein kinase [Ktedonobacteraceae bacterium]